MATVCGNVSSLLQREAAKKEIYYHRSFRHPNLLPLVDAAMVEDSKHGTVAYILLPYLPGGSLRDHINRRILAGTALQSPIPKPSPYMSSYGKAIVPFIKVVPLLLIYVLTNALGESHWSESSILEVFAGVCQGVRELHGNKPPLAHRDIKVRQIVGHAPYPLHPLPFYQNATATCPQSQLTQMLLPPAFPA